MDKFAILIAFGWKGVTDLRLFASWGFTLGRLKGCRLTCVL